MGDITSIRNTGNDSQRVNLVIVAEGYTAAERGKFLSDAARLTDYMFDASNKRLNDPFSTYKNYFDVDALFVASAQSGADRPNAGVAVDTYFDAMHRGSDERLLYGDEIAVKDYVAQNVAADAREVIIVLVNTAVYGGAGGLVAWAAADNPSSYEIALHEIGHSFAGLQDEYVDPALVSTFLMTDPAFLNSVHVTDSPSRIPWSAWMGYSDELGTVGVYEGGYYRETGVWRATPTSKMYALDLPYSAPEREAFVHKFYDAIGHYAAIKSPVAGIMKADVPDASLVQLGWTFHNKPAGDADSVWLDLGASGASLSGTVTLTATDSSGYVRNGLGDTTDSASFFLNQRIITTCVQSVTLSAANTLYRLSAADNNIKLDNTAIGCYVDGGAGRDIITFGFTTSWVEMEWLSTGTILLEHDGAPIIALRNIEAIRFSDTTVEVPICAKAATLQLMGVPDPALAI